MFGIQWSENEQNILFPEMENSKQPDVLQVNSIVCMGEEDDNQEEDVRPYNDLNCHSPTTTTTPTTKQP